MLLKFDSILDLVHDKVLSQNFKCVGSIPLIFIDKDYELKSSDECHTQNVVVRRDNNLPRNYIKEKILKSAINNTSQKNIRIFIDALKKQVANPLILIIGGGRLSTSLLDYINKDEIRFISFDVYPSENVTFCADAHNIPLKDGSVDGVILQYVLEHVENPKRVVMEVYRVLNSNGHVFAETPFLQQVHEGPYDFTRFTKNGHRILFKDFEEIYSGVAMGITTQILWTVECVVYGVTRSKMFSKAVKLSLFWFQWLEFIFSKESKIKGASAFAFIGKKSQTDNHIDIVDYYNKSIS